MLQKSSIELVAEVFFNFPTRDHTLKEISNYTQIAHTSVKKNLLKLVKIGLIIERVEKKGKRKFPVYKAGRANKLFIQCKKIYNLQSIIESGVIKYIGDRLAPKSIVVFGSYLRGEDTEESDIDLFVESKHEELQLKQFEKKLLRYIDIHFKENFTSYQNELKNNIVNGIVLHGFLEGY